MTDTPAIPRIATGVGLAQKVLVEHVPFKQYTETNKDSSTSANEPGN